ncbi:uncharacterized protein F5891DRAFT_1196425 [Suillus fuscotomentosus]|uniref:Uncharacterized protein n=1 Tax=Suillus fuscotomentosus TaxID=1912939 RepID=A0AAD4DTB6_9AGAM|nr:uncharacterized protein F5891DRAFT_1196425 [Suillus fuscotomentosus]KAG1893476.1 hypothetical protein F5891DRAFT_1196425 [Suillus fuscotomentosus]
MASRCLALTPKFAQRSGARFLSTTRVLREEASTSPNLGSVQPQKRPVGGFRGGSAFAAYHLLDEYKLASAALQASVEELQASTEKV